MRLLMIGSESFCMLIMCFLVKTLRLGTIGALRLIDQMD